MKDRFIYHIADATEWEESRKRGSYAPASVEAEGFIHCSVESALARVANLFFKGQDGLVLLKIDASMVTSPLQYDFVEDMGVEFPHIYGPLNPDAVVEVLPFFPDANGTFSFPK